MDKKKVISLYRVSSKKQVDRIRSKDSEEDRFDIPLQKQACREFISAKPNWELYRELSELGISGYKVSAKKRDAIQEIQQEALAGRFDVLLVFMFDRLGRIDDETPFVVEWFVKQGIEVWSVKEGEQRFESHVDKLTNYIRFWQASGESEKTSIRTKERLSQMVQEGRFRGGIAPYGYRLVKRGRLNKKGYEVNELEIDEQESVVVQKVFELYLTHGMGSQRIATYLSKHGIKTRKGQNFTNVSINNMLSNITYSGILRSGDARSDIIPNIQIISPQILQAAIELKEERARAIKNEHRVPLNTRGSSLLIGKAYCGHCGGRLVVTTNGKKYVRKDGGVSKSYRTRYVCYNKTRHKSRCDGQTGYTVGKLDKMIDKVVHKLFAELNDLPKELIVEQRYERSIAERRTALSQAKIELHALAKEISEYEAETLKVIRGESKLNAELLSKLYEEARVKEKECRLRMQRLENEIENGKQAKAALSEQFTAIQSWADMYDNCEIEVKKMILSHMFNSVKVRRDYEVEIEMKVDYEQFNLKV